MSGAVDVLVVGAGPAGLTLACDLQRRDVRHRLISASPGGFEGSRAKAIQPRTLEVFYDLGLLAYVEERSTLYPKLGIHVGPITVPKAMVPLHSPTEDVPHPNTLLVAQYDTDAALRRRLSELGGTVEFGSRLLSWIDTPDGVVATVAHADGTTEQVTTRYLIGADGGGSIVRSTSGIAFPGTTDENDRMIVADLTLEGLSRTRWHVWPRNSGRFMGLCPLPDGKFQLMLKLKPDEEADVGQDAVEELIANFVGKARITIHAIHWSSVWRPNIRLAERYRHGQVLLIGDAAHVHPPTGGQGMNTGIQDAYNLGWKLAQVLGGAPDSLLDTYEAERQPVAARVLGLSTEIYSAMSSKPMAAATRGDEERQLALSYAGGPLARTTEGSPAPRAGDRAPDARYIDEVGLTTTLHETFRGPHFTFVAIGEGAAGAAAGFDWPWRSGAPLVSVAIAEPSRSLAEIYGVTGPRRILVRPDGYIAAVADGTGPGGAAFEDFLARIRPDTTP